MYKTYAEANAKRQEYVDAGVHATIVLATQINPIHAVDHSPVVTGFSLKLGDNPTCKTPLAD